MVALSQSIFKAYDIRGIIGKTLDEGVARSIGHAFGLAAAAKGERSVVTAACPAPAWPPPWRRACRTPAWT
jgi:phosphomannomutase